MKNKDIIISVVIPFYNREHTLANCINSVLNQSVPPYEVLCVDDHSTDRSDSIIKEFEKKDSRVKLIANLPEKKGAQSARNLGAQHAKGDWICFLDSDDEWVRDCLKIYCSELSKMKFKPNAVLYCDCYKLNGDYRNSDEKKFSLEKKNIWKLPNIKKHSSYKDLLKHPAPMFGGMIINKSLLVKSGYLNENVISYQEWDTSIRLAKNGGNFIHIKYPLLIYYVGEKNTISTDFSKDIIGQYDMIERYREEIMGCYGDKYLTKRYKGLLFFFLSRVNDYNWDSNEKLLSVIKSIIVKAKVGEGSSNIPPLYRL